jgi:sortase A
VSSKRPSDELTVEELRRLLIEKRRSERQDRLEHYRRTGRVIAVNPEPLAPTIESMRTVEVVEGDDFTQDPDLEKRRQRRKRLFDRLLFLLEIVALAGLVMVFFVLFNSLRTLNKEVSTSLVLPTLTPTPLISVVVLPSGHTPPNSPGGAQPNEAEIPEHLRPLVQSLASVPIPTPGPEQAVRIQIPAIKVDAPIVQGDGWEQLKKGVGQYIGSPNPGKKGNMVLSAHNDIYGEIFRYLDKLKTGDQIIIYSMQHQYIYLVTGSKIVGGNQVEVMAPTDRPTVTLISCYPYLVDNKRIVISAEFQSN